MHPSSPRWLTAVWGAVIAVGLATPWQSATAGFQEGVEAYQRADYPQAVLEWQAAAEAGDMAAMRNLGQLYRWGRGVPRDLAKARSWYQKAAELGFDRAQYNLAIMVLTGTGGTKDPTRAAYWLQRAVAQGEAAAMVELAGLYDSGVGVAKDPEQVQKLLNQAAAVGEPRAQSILDGKLSLSDAVAPTPDSPDPSTVTPSAATATSRFTGPAPAGTPQLGQSVVQLPGPNRQPLPIPPVPIPPVPIPPVLSPPAVLPPATPPPAGTPPLPALTQPVPPSPTALAVPKDATAMAQIGIYKSKALALAGWQAMLPSIPALADTQQEVMESAVAGQGRIWRLYARVINPAHLVVLCAQWQHATGNACDVQYSFKK